MSYLIYRGSPLGGLIQKAESVTFDNTGTGLSASDVQGAIEEVGSINNAGLKLNTSDVIIPTFIKFTNASNKTYYYKVGTRVFINFSVADIQSTGTFFTLPEGYRPRDSVYAILLGNNFGKRADVAIEPTGNVDMHYYEETGAYGCIMYDAFN